MFGNFFANLAFGEPAYFTIDDYQGPTYWKVTATGIEDRSVDELNETVGGELEVANDPNFEVTQAKCITYDVELLGSEIEDLKNVSLPSFQATAVMEDGSRANTWELFTADDFCTPEGAQEIPGLMHEVEPGTVYSAGTMTFGDDTGLGMGTGLSIDPRAVEGSGGGEVQWQ